MADEKIRQYTVDTRFDAHASFFDHDWARRVSAAAEGGPLDDATFNLIEGWKGAANTARLPWLTIHLMGTFAEAFINNSGKEDRLVPAAAAHLSNAITPPLSESQRRSLSRNAGKLISDITQTLNANPYQFDPNEHWAEMMGLSEFTLSIVASQRLAFAAVYYSYEDFVLSCFTRFAAMPDYRIGKTFPIDLAKVYSPALADEIWTHPEVKRARLVRHAIVHNGCRDTKELQKIGHGIPVVDGILQITAPFVRAEFDSLKDRASLMLRETVSRLTTP